jgi:hypothetical protein
MKFRFVFWVILQCKIIVDRRFRGTYCSIIIALMVEAARTSETSVENYCIRQYLPEYKSELQKKKTFLSKGSYAYMFRSYWTIISDDNNTLDNTSYNAVMVTLTFPYTCYNQSTHKSN